MSASSLEVRVGFVWFFLLLAVLDAWCGGLGMGTMAPATVHQHNTVCTAPLGQFLYYALMVPPAARYGTAC